MFKFIYAKHKIHPKVDEYYEGWYLLIDNSDSFMSFINIRSKGLVEKYWKLKNMNKKYTGHLSDWDMITMELMAECRPNRKNVVDDIFMVSDMLKGYSNLYFREGKFVVNCNNGCRHIDDTFEILRTVERKNLIFPITSEKDIRIIKWDNGTHYYTKIGNQDVVIDGKQKWDSHKEAYRAGVKFLNRIGDIK